MLLGVAGTGDRGGVRQAAPGPPGARPQHPTPQARPRRVSDSEIRPPAAERVWHTSPVTSGRIIIGWRVGT